MEKRKYFKPETTVYALPELLTPTVEASGNADSNYKSESGDGGGGDAKGFSLWDDEKEWDD